MPFLKFGNVFITSEMEDCLTVRTSEDSYSLARKVLLVLKDSAGLPVSLHGESVADTLISIREREGVPRQNAVLDLITTDNFIRSDNEFLIPAWKMGIKGKENLKAFAEELSTHLTTQGLEVVINI